MTKTHALCCCSIAIVLLLALTAADANAPLIKKIIALYPQADTNGDGILTDAEEDAVSRLALQRYPRADRDRDGVLSDVEKQRLLRTLAHRAPLQSASPATGAAATTTSLESTPIHSTGVESPLRQGPHPVKSGEHGIGRQIPDLVFTDIAGKQQKLSDFATHKALVFAMTGTGCPLCLKYAPSLAAIEQQYLERGVAFVFVNPNQSEQLEQLQDAVNTHGFHGPYVRDGEKRLLGALGAETTTEVFLLDRVRTLVYRGAVDDQYGFAYALDAPHTSYLTDALDAVLAGTTPQTQATTAPGCELLYDKTSETQTSITYHNRVSRIVQANCIECHRKGGIAPISLESYQEVKDYAAMIRNVVHRGTMPPWFAAPQPASKEEENHSLHWSNDRSLTAQEKSDLFAWIQAGSPEGDPANAPIPKTFPGGWLIGKPDAVFEFPRPIPIKATGIMPYKHVTVETNLPEDKWVQAIEVRPGKLDVVHHVIVSVQEGESKLDECNGYWGAYVPGNSTLVYPGGYARRLPKGAKLCFQMHYTPNGTATEDSTRIGVVFARQPPRHEVHVAALANSRISIPPHAGNHREVAELRLPYDVQIMSFLPHMHLRGKAARYEALTVNGEETLLDIPRYDFNWQLLYRLAEPRMLHRGDTIRFTGWFDNSMHNPANPDPDKTVCWGRQTEDEMHIGYVEYVVPGAKPGEPVARMKSGRSASGRRNTAGTGELRIGGQCVKTTVLIKTLRKLDKNQDGKLQQVEVPRKRQ
jgi:thiol-disulfide isomerase/thioredoxin/mono/diheme cytochrome c family protein